MVVRNYSNKEQTIIILNNEFLTGTFSSQKDCKHLVTEKTEIYSWPKTYRKCYVATNPEFGLLGVYKTYNQAVSTLTNEFVKRDIFGYFETWKCYLNEHIDCYIGPVFYGLYDCHSGMILLEKMTKDTLVTKRTSMFRSREKLYYFSTEKTARKKFLAVVEDMRVQR